MHFSNINISKHPTNQNTLRFEPLPDIGNLLPINTPKAYAPIKTKIKATIHKYKNNLWLITIIGGLIVLILGTWILVKIGVLH